MREEGESIETLKAAYEEGWKRLREIAFVLGGDADADPVRVAEGLRGRCEALAQKGVEAEERRLADEQTIRNLGRQLQKAETTERERCARQLEELARFERGQEQHRRGWVNVSWYKADALEWGACAIRVSAGGGRQGKDPAGIGGRPAAPARAQQDTLEAATMVAALRQCWRGIWRLFTGGRPEVSWHDVLEHAEAAGLVARVAYGPDVKDTFEIVGGDCEEGDLVWVPTALGRAALGEGAAR